MNEQPKTYAIGTKFSRRVSAKRTDVCTVTDILKTYNLAGELVRMRYVATHQFMGQTVTDHDVVATTIDRNLIPAENARFADVSCSRCAQSFGPGDAGFSHCDDHAHLIGRPA